MAIVPRATHPFEEPGKLEEVASLARGWFTSHLGAPAAASVGGGATEHIHHS